MLPDGGLIQSWSRSYVHTGKSIWNVVLQGIDELIGPYGF